MENKKLTRSTHRMIAGVCDLKNVDIEVNGESKAKVNCDFMWEVEAVTNIIKNCVEHTHTSLYF